MSRERSSQGGSGPGLQAKQDCAARQGQHKMTKSARSRDRVNAAVVILLLRYKPPASSILKSLTLVQILAEVCLIARLDPMILFNFWSILVMWRIVAGAIQNRRRIPRCSSLTKLIECTNYASNTTNRSPVRRQINASLSCRH